MSSLIIAHPSFEAHWPFVAETFYHHWQAGGPTELLRLKGEAAQPLSELCTQPGQVARLACLGVMPTLADLQAFTTLQEATFSAGYRDNLPQACQDYLEGRAVQVYQHRSEGFWGQSVSEFALALTLCGLRRIPQQHHEMIATHAGWNRYRADSHQFSDDPNFTNGTIAGKRVRIVGAGNIGSRYASFVHMLGADVAAWDPFATEAHFHRAGSRREWHLDVLAQDAQIFVPMLPLTESTRGLVTAAHIDALPAGCLVVLATRANICHMPALRRRVLADELALAADVFDVEPVPLDDPLLGRHNVAHTPHIAGRTKDANVQWARDLLDQFRPL